MTAPLIDETAEPKDAWRPGVTTRMVASAANGTRQLCVFEQWCDPGLGAPTHLHAVEEILTVLAGDARIVVGEVAHAARAGHSVVIPAGIKHSFSNTGTTVLHVRAILASPVFEAAYDDARETPRRWLPGMP